MRLLLRRRGLVKCRVWDGWIRQVARVSKHSGLRRSLQGVRVAVTARRVRGLSHGTGSLPADRRRGLPLPLGSVVNFHAYIRSDARVTTAS
jgi:hypothetical protein